MIGTADPYYLLPSVSNSDLGMMEEYFMNKEILYERNEAYRFGNLIDAMITEPDRCDHMNFRVDDEQFTQSEWFHAKRMLKAFREDSFCQQLMKTCTGQKVHEREMQLEYEGISFSMMMRCKYDLWSEALKYGADIKSTAATTHDQFVAACLHFNYDRSRAMYMDLGNAEKDIIIGISKVNYKVFKIFINHAHAFYINGKQKYQELAFKWWYLFEEF